MTEVLSRSPSTWNIGTTTELSQNVAAGVSKPAVPGGRRMKGRKGGERRGAGGRRPAMAAGSGGGGGWEVGREERRGIPNPRLMIP